MYHLQQRLRNDCRLLNNSLILDKQLLILHLGSNMSNRMDYLNTALIVLESAFGKALKTSSIYETKAWGNTHQADFLNQAAIYETAILPQTILKIIKILETEIGRKLREHWHKRERDIDIIFYGNEIVKEQNIEIPHAQMHNRRFVLVPLNEICPEYIHPLFNKTVAELLRQSTDNLNVEKWNKP